MSESRDVVAGALQQWEITYPGMDFEPVAVIGRISRCATLLHEVTEMPLGRAGLSRTEFEILCALRRADALEPAGVPAGEAGRTPSQLARETYASPAAVTKRVRALEQRGLVTRRSDARDRRVAHLTLTDSGRDLADHLIPQQLSYEKGLITGLPEAERADLARILSEFLLVLEGRLGGR
ncbi:MarR family winged helix-turn-helix transcriptional regulator [Nocardia sp. alder85J]|uniref:MarR family winged helix-turn-helix transcriptional regulator n=1 Tax=Nocardia sp. alder85J TaxID=2862949 RepID=UPI001CD256E8|nr:MarR family transcriptional regulator [Nocardia sp. alder85J]MCX4097013.1 MarR family transcriptional regulator [Nocardia sp. alder85J]